MIKFLDQDQNENVVECSEEEEHDTFHNHCTSSNETALISGVSNTVENENIIVAPGQRKSQFRLLMTSLVKSWHFPSYFHMVSLGIKLNVIYLFPQLSVWIIDCSITHKFTQIFADDADYIFSTRSVIEQQYLSSSINTAIKKLKPWV